MTIIGLVRHGITDWNVAKRDQGQTDIPLNEIGRSQARALADRLRDEKWEVVYASDLSRARETAEIIAAPLTLSVHTDARLREVDYGEREGTTLEDRIARWGEQCESLVLGRESHVIAAERSLAAIADIVSVHEGRRILVVSHGELIEVLLTHLLADRKPDGVLHNTSLTLLNKRDDQWECDLFNCTKHVK